MARVLVVEDDPVNALVLERVLERMGGHEVTVSDDAETVLSLCADGQVDLVVMDVSLANTSYQGERLDGVKLTRLIREEDGGASPPVLLVTAHAMRGDRERLLQDSGADGYVSKPIVDHAEFTRIVAEALEQRRLAA